MTSVGDFQLYWWDTGSLCGDDDSQDEHVDQYVFTTRASAPLPEAGLSRVRTVHDLMQLLAEHDVSLSRFAVASVALLFGNLIAVGQWLYLACAIAVGFTVAVLQLRLPALAAVGVLVSVLMSNMWHGLLSVEWMTTVSFVVILALFLLVVIEKSTKQDSRRYVLLPEGSPQGRQSPPTSPQPQSLLPGRPRIPSSPKSSAASTTSAADRPASVVISNHCCMDVKLLIFEGEDAVRMIPIGGLLGGTRVPREGSCHVGDNPPYRIRVYYPWEKELGEFYVPDGRYSFRATAPPLVLRSSDRPRFTNCSEAPVVLCVGAASCWTASLWLPFAPLFSRALWKGQTVQPNQEVKLSGPCLLRVYSGPLGLAEDGCCSLRAGERVEYVGSITWSRPPVLSRKSVSSLFKLVR